jgi:transketolase
MRTTFINTLIERARTDESIFLLTPDMGFSVFEKYIELFPNRYLNVGIAEQNAIGVAAGLALSGYKVYVYSIVPFVTMRCFEQVRLDVAYMNTNVKLIGVGGGYSYGPAGATHHAIEDIAIMRSLPNMTICCPGDPLEARQLVEQSLSHPCPMYIRLGKNNEPLIHSVGDRVQFGKASVLRKGSGFALITTGNMLEQGKAWIDAWVLEGYDPEFISMHTVKPLDEEIIGSIVDRGMGIVTLEEHTVIGGLGAAVSDYVAGRGSSSRVMKIGIPDIFSHYVGSQKALREHYGLASRPDMRAFRTLT